MEIFSEDTFKSNFIRSITDLPYNLLTPFFKYAVSEKVISLP